MFVVNIKYKYHPRSSDWGEAIIKLSFSLLDSSLLTLTWGAGPALSMVTTDNNKTCLNLDREAPPFLIDWNVQTLLNTHFPNFPFSKLFPRIFIIAAWQMLLIVHFADVIQSISSRPRLNFPLNRNSSLYTCLRLTRTRVQPPWHVPMTR